MRAAGDKSYDVSLTVALTDPDEAAAYIDAVTGPGGARAGDKTLCLALGGNGIRQSTP